MMSATGIRGRSRGAQARSSRRRSFSALPSTLVDLGHGGEAGGLDLRGAAGDDDARLGLLARAPADRLAGLALGLGGDGAGVDHHGVGEPGRGGWPRMTSVS